MKVRTGVLAVVASVTAAVVAATTVVAAPRMEGQGNLAIGYGSVAMTFQSSFGPEIQAAARYSVATRRISAPVPLGTVLSDSVTVLGARPSGGTLRWKTACGRYDDVLKALDKKKRVSGWCFEGADETNVSWVPQGIATTTEAAPSGKVAGQSAVAVSWYRRTTAVKSSPGIRVSLFRTPKAGHAVHYNHVALVAPFVGAGGLLDFADIKAHVGGVAWSGPYLFVPQTNWGVRVFDTRQIYRVPLTTRSGTAKPLGAPGAIDARYAMLQVGSYRTSAACAMAAALPPCFSTLSIDRTGSPARLVVAEHLSPAEYAKLHRGASVVAWDLGPDGLLAPDPAQPQYTSDVTFVAFTRSMQGAVVDTRHRTIYTSSSDPTNGWAYYERDGDGHVPRKTSEWPAGAESLSLASGKLWSLTEVVRKRMIFNVYACELRGGSSTCR